MPEAVIAAAVRTPIGRAHKGSLADVRPDDLAAFAVRTLVAQVPELDPAEIVDVIVGCGFPEQKQGMNLARRAAKHNEGTPTGRRLEQIAHEIEADRETLRAFMAELGVPRSWTKNAAAWIPQVMQSGVMQAPTSYPRIASAGPCRR